MNDSLWEISNEIQSVAIRLVDYVDSGRASEVADFFAETAEMRIGEAVDLKSIEQIREFFQQRQANIGLKTRHIITNFRVLPSVADNYRAEYLYTVYRGPVEGTSVAETIVCDVSESYCRVLPDEWKITSRAVIPVFQPL